MSIDLVRGVLDLNDSRLSSSERFVLLDYAEHANEDTRLAWPSAATVARETSLGVSTVERALGRLRGMGFLIKTSKRRTGEHAWVWVYEVALAAADGLAEEPPQRGNLKGRGTPNDAVEEPPQRGTNRKREPEVPTTETPSGVSARTLVAEWIDHCQTKPASRVIGQVARELKILLETDGMDPDVVRRGLAEWHRKRIHPSALASVVTSLALGPAERQSRADRAVEDGSALIARLAAEEAAALPAAPPPPRPLRAVGS